MWAAIGELLFTVVVSYMGAIELFFVARQLYHLAFQHEQRQRYLTDDSSLRRLQDQVESEIVEATGRELYGYNAMKDGVLYKDGIRIDPAEINDHEKLHRQVIGSSKASLEREDRTTSADVIPNSRKLPSESEAVEEVVEEPCVKKHVERYAAGRRDVEETSSADDQRTNITQTIKTQVSQKYAKDYLPTTETEQSRRSPLKVDETLTTQEPQSTPTETFSPLSQPLRFDEYEREEPEGQDVPEPQYSDEYLRSLDGIKIRPLVRNDGSGRRRAFKKRRSSESTSSRESRASREEELQMFTSLEEAEFESIRRGDSDYVPIRYSSDPNLIKIGKHQRRHKKSPIKDFPGELDTEESKSSLEMLDEENTSPWGDVKPEHYKDSEFWKREKAVSIEEESENVPTWSEDVPKEQAGQLTASPSPTKNIPKLSSFEQATPSQHENAVSNLGQQKAQDKVNKSTEKEGMENVSTDADSQAEQLLASYDRKASGETEDEDVACTKPDDKAEKTGLRRSPRLEDMDRYEEHLREQDNEVVPALSHPAQLPQNNDLSKSQLTDIRPEITSAASIDEQNFSAIPSDTDTISSPLGTDALRGNSPRQLDRPKTPVIEIGRAADDGRNSLNEPSNDVDIVSESGLLEGISDFYDFNASINPSRSPSVDRSVSKSRSPCRGSREASKLSENSQAVADDTSPRKVDTGLSDFYDYNVMINQEAYGSHDRAHETHRSTTDYLAEKLKEKKSRSKSPLPPISIPKNEDLGLQEKGGGTGSFKQSPSPALNTPKTPKSPRTLHGSEEEGAEARSLQEGPSPLDTPMTPEYQRTISANMRYVESMRDDYVRDMYKRSRYVGESMDFENDFEELREQTRHFRRSRSQSRSPILEEDEPSTSAQAEARRELQERILDEITRTTINYQDFSNDYNKSYLDFDRRGSDSALIQRPELMIQIEDQCKGRSSGGDDDGDIFDAEDYHHFRRFSLNQEQQTEEYPEDDYLYVEQIEVQTLTGSRSWTRKDYRDPEGKDGEISIREADNIGEESDHAEADDVDTESEDDRQTVVDVDDEIDEDVWDYERPEESNDQSECEEAEREMDRYADKNAKDWSEDGAVGGVCITTEDTPKIMEDTINIDQMYDDAVKSTGETGIQEDYDTIVKAMNEEDRETSRNSTELSDSISIRTEELLDEILREDEERYKHRSPRRDKIEASRNFIEYEARAGSTLLKNGITLNNRSSTRLRSRYGIAPSPAYRTYENLDEATVDLNYKPKKEYKWRKNFKLDEDDPSHGSNSPEEDDEENQRYSEELASDGATQSCDALFTKTADEDESPGSIENSSSSNTNFEETQVEDAGENERLFDVSSIEAREAQEEKSDHRKGDTDENERLFGVSSIKTRKEREEKSDHKKIRSIKEEEREAAEKADLVSGGFEEAEKLSKKKKTKRRSRKGSKGSIGGEEEVQQVSQSDAADKNESQPETGAKKKIKKKKRVSEITSPPDNIRSPSPCKIDPLSTTNLSAPPKSPSSPLRQFDAPKQPQESAAVKEDTISQAAHLTTTSITTKSKSKSPEPVVVKTTGPKDEPSGTSTSPKPRLERNDSTGVYELIKDGSMYPWF